MAIGRELGTFEMKSTTMMLEPGKGDRLTVHINFEGNITGELECVVISTMTFDTNKSGKDGTYKLNARCILADGELLDTVGHGQTTHEGNHIWGLAGVADVTGRAKWAIKGKLDFDNRICSGTIFDRD